MKKKFKCDVDCAACAAKLEDALKKIEGVEGIAVNFIMQRLTLEAADENFDAVLSRVRDAAKKIEPDMTIE